MKSSKIITLLISSLLFMNLMTFGQKGFAVVFYNVNNLYDTINQPDVADDEYTPASGKQWNTTKYNTKLNNIAKVISSVNAPGLPEIVGLAEVENKNILKDLVANPLLKSGNYQIVHEESPDRQGLDVAFLYKKGFFRYLSHKKIPIDPKLDSALYLRDILYVKGIVNKIDTLHIFINHWKSRKEGSKKTESIRVFSAKVLEKQVDSLIKLNKKSKIIVMGDFNDEPTDKSLFKTLDGTNRRKNTTNSELYNLLYDKHNIGNEGTFYYKNQWFMFDQILISQGLLKTKHGLITDHDAGKIFKPEWLLIKNPKDNKVIPYATFAGSKYLGGFSDHLPVYFILKTKK